MQHAPRNSLSIPPYPQMLVKKRGRVLLPLLAIPARHTLSSSSTGIEARSYLVSTGLQESCFQVSRSFLPFHGDRNTIAPMTLRLFLVLNRVCCGKSAAPLRLVREMIPILRLTIAIALLTNTPPTALFKPFRVRHSFPFTPQSTRREVREAAPFPVGWH